MLKMPQTSAELKATPADPSIMWVSVINSCSIPNLPFFQKKRISCRLSCSEGVLCPVSYRYQFPWLGLSVLIGHIAAHAELLVLIRRSDEGFQPLEFERVGRRGLSRSRAKFHSIRWQVSISSPVKSPVRIFVSRALTAAGNTPGLSETFTVSPVEKRVRINSSLSDVLIFCVPKRIRPPVIYVATSP